MTFLQDLPPPGLDGDRNAVQRAQQGMLSIISWWVIEDMYTDAGPGDSGDEVRTDHGEPDCLASPSPPPSQPDDVFVLPDNSANALASSAEAPACRAESPLLPTIISAAPAIIHSDEVLPETSRHVAPPTVPTAPSAMSSGRQLRKRVRAVILDD